MINPFETWTWWNWGVAAFVIFICVWAVVAIWQGFGDGD